MIKKLLLIALVIVTLIGLPLTVYISQQKQKPKSHASSATSLYFLPTNNQSSPLTAQVGGTIPLDIMIDPGTNAVSFVKIHIHFDPTKFQGINSNPLVINQAAFPTILEGPVNTYLANGDIYVALSVGSDLTKAIRNAPARIGTLTLKAIQTTNGDTTSVSYGSDSTATSGGAGDQISQDVLASAIPAYLIVIEVPTLTPTPTVTPTLTPTPSPTPTDTPTPTPTLAPQSTLLNATVFLHSIGNSGDTLNPASSLSNKDPKPATRTVTVSLYNGSGTLVVSKDTELIYMPGTGNFMQGSTTDHPSLNLGTNFPAGNYTVKIKTHSFLQKAILNVIAISPGSPINLPAVTLVAGDANNDNLLTILDYNKILGCYSDLLPPTFCDDAKKVDSDLNSDEHVNQIDYNLFLREFNSNPGN